MGKILAPIVKTNNIQMKVLCKRICFGPYGGIFYRIKLQSLTSPHKKGVLYVKKDEYLKCKKCEIIEVKEVVRKKGKSIVIQLLLNSEKNAETVEINNQSNFDKHILDSDMEKEILKSYKKQSVIELLIDFITEIFHVLCLVFLIIEIILYFC